MQGGQAQYYVQYQPYFDYSYSYYQRSQSEQEYFAIHPQMLALDPRTTLMIKNIPNKYTIRFLAEEIDRRHNNTYDFLYLPYDMKVPLSLLRTTATSATVSLTSSALRP